MDPKFLNTFVSKENGYHYTVTFYADHIMFKADEFGAGKNVSEKKIEKKDLKNELRF